MSAEATASGTSFTVKPEAVALATEGEFGRKPTTTSTPESFNNRYFFAFDDRKISVFIVINLHSFSRYLR
jgi:hypothetical protein